MEGEFDSGGVNGWGVTLPGRHSLPTQAIVGVNADGRYQTASIQDVKVGQEVLSQNAGNPAGTPEEEAVTGVETHIVYVLRAVTVQAADGTSETIDTTDSHPFYVQGSGWVSAGDLQAGETLQTSDGQTVTVVRTYRIAEPQGVKVYNLTVAGDHTYFVEPAGVVGGEAVWVHNGLCVMETGEYAEMVEDLKGTGEQANHLNQDAAYGDTIPTEEGIANGLYGNAFTDRGTPHYEFHKSLETFWDQYRDGGAKVGDKPTNAEYGEALTDALKSAGYTRSQARSLATRAANQRVAYGLAESDPVPNIPERIYQRK